MIKAACNFILFLITLNLSAQCLVDRHNTSINDSWLSCTTSLNPNPLRGTSHWIMFDFSFIHSLKQVQIWNYNHPDFLNRGAKDIIVDVSIDGVSWTHVQNFTLTRSSGIANYLGETITDLGEIPARFFLLTILNNYGDSCVGLSEIKIGVKDEIECVEDLHLTGDLLSKKYYANNSLTTDGQLSINEILHLQSGHYIELLPDFLSFNGAELVLEISPCQ